MITEQASLTRADLAEAMHRNVGLSRAEALLFVEGIMEHIGKALARGEDVKIAGFGTFLLHDKQERIGRNPKSGAMAVVTARRVVTFRASTALKERVADVDRS